MEGGGAHTLRACRKPDRSTRACSRMRCSSATRSLQILLVLQDLVGSAGCLAPFPQLPPRQLAPPQALQADDPPLRQAIPVQGCVPPPGCLYPGRCILLPARHSMSQNRNTSINVVCNRHCVCMRRPCFMILLAAFTHMQMVSLIAAAWLQYCRYTNVKLSDDDDLLRIPKMVRFHICLCKIQRTALDLFVIQSK